MVVAVIHGGTSTECDVSTLNAKYIADALTELGYQVVSLFYDKNIMTELAVIKPDTVFLCVQGKHHGDGTLQAVLDLLEIPYTGSKMKASAVINDKILCKKLFKLADISTPSSFEWSLNDYLKDNGKPLFVEQMKQHGIHFPCVAKAPSQGGSFGLVLLESLADYEKMADSFQYDNTILIEQFIVGRFLTVGLLERDTATDISLPVMEGISHKQGKIITMDAAYSAVPASLPAGISAQLREIAKQVFTVCETKSYARVDFILEDITLKPYVLEINAVPGLKKSSLYPPAAKLAGIEYNELINIILLNSFK